MYRVPRQGKPARHIRIVRLIQPRSRQPKVRYVLVTKSGKRKQPKGAVLPVSWLVWRDGAWHMPPGFELLA